jgi:hypothetical protein
MVARGESLDDGPGISGKVRKASNEEVFAWLDTRDWRRRDATAYKQKKYWAKPIHWATPELTRRRRELFVDNKLDSGGRVE